MATAITIHRTTFTEDEISVYDSDGNLVEYADIPHDDDHTDTDTISWDPDCGPRVDWAIRVLSGEGLSFRTTGSDWAADPDGSYISDYATGERVETSGHLYGFAPSEIRYIMAQVG